MCQVVPGRNKANFLNKIGVSELPHSNGSKIISVGSLEYGDIDSQEPQRWPSINRPITVFRESDHSELIELENCLEYASGTSKHLQPATLKPYFQ